MTIDLNASLLNPTALVASIALHGIAIVFFG